MGSQVFHRAIVQASLPVVAEHATAITGRFYERLFESNPALLHVFNQGNQASGEQKQALAGAVHAYAKHCDDTAALEPLFRRIAHKHASLGVAPEMYRVVGENLLAAIGDVLGAEATAEVLEAWGAVYWRFARELCAREEALYREAGISPQRFLREYKVIERTAEGEVAVSLRLVPTDKRPAPSFKPGQYVSVEADLPEIGLRQLRQYSLSDAANGETLRITVKRESGDGSRPDGLVSTHVTRHVSTSSAGNPAAAQRSSTSPRTARA